LKPGSTGQSRGNVNIKIRNGEDKMKLDGNITILIGRDETKIEIRDDKSSIVFACITLSPEQLSMCLSRQGEVECKLEVQGLDKVGKQIHRQDFTFELPPEADWRNRKELAEKLAVELCPEGWQPRLYFGSKDSFCQKDDRIWARIQIVQFEELK
jgi:hypothetical protein